jgi:hypothetical protein
MPQGADPSVTPVLGHDSHINDDVTSENTTCLVMRSARLPLEWVAVR